MRMIRERALGGVDFGAMLIEGNRAFATRFNPQYAAMFDRIAIPANLPTLVHCTGGKDRTGFAAAIVLRALGVPEETVFEDYLLTNVYTANEIERNLMLLRVYLFFRTKPEAIRPLLGVRRDYLEAAFDTIDERYGSLEAYLREGLGVSDEELAQMRAQLLE
jgi:protein-tyrosine phosphatase